MNQESQTFNTFDNFSLHQSQNTLTIKATIAYPPLGKIIIWSVLAIGLFLLILLIPKNDIFQLLYSILGLILCFLLTYPLTQKFIFEKTLFTLDKNTNELTSHLDNFHTNLTDIKQIGILEENPPKENTEIKLYRLHFTLQDGEKTATFAFNDAQKLEEIIKTLVPTAQSIPTAKEQQPDNPHPSILPASQHKRFLNNTIDFYCIILILFILSQIVGKNLEKNIIDYIITALFMIAYYAWFEYFWQKTPAKFLTKTKVISQDGTPPTFNQILSRSFSRLVPFENLSFLSSRNPQGWHDKWSQTIVIDETGPKTPKTNPLLETLIWALEYIGIEIIFFLTIIILSYLYGSILHLIHH